MRFLLLTLAFFLAAGSGETPLLRGEIQALDGQEATLNIGSRNGVVEGMLFRVYEPDKVYLLPFSQEEVVREGRVLAELRVTHVAERFCRAHIPQGAALSTGLLVLGRPAVAQGNSPPKIEGVTWDSPQGVWGREMVISARGADTDGNEVQLQAHVSAGSLENLRPGSWLWHPPKRQGTAHVTIDATDGIASVNEVLVLEHTLNPHPRFSPEARVLLGEGRFTFETADRIQVDDRGLLWILDRNSRTLTGLGPSLRQVAFLDLEDLDPLAFSVAGDRIAVLDGRSSSVHLWDRSLKPIAQVGLEGRGVHEWEEAVDVLLLPDGTLCVLDGERQTVVVHTPAGLFRCAIGHPGSTPPGFIRAIALEPAGSGFAVIDAGQHLRHVFDATMTYRESRPLGENTLSIVGPGTGIPTRWPEGLQPSGCRSITRTGSGEFLALDAKGSTLLSFTETASADRVLRWEFRARGRRLAEGPGGEPHMFDRETGLRETLDTLGWRKRLPMDLKVDELGDFIPTASGPGIMLDSRSCRVVIGNHRFGQRGDGLGMMDEPEEILRWRSLIAVLDRGNEKVLLFREDGTLDKERPFKDALSFCPDGEGLAVLAEDGRLHRWGDPGGEPTTLEIGKGTRIRRIEGGFAMIDKDGVTIFDLDWKPLDKLKVPEALDVMQCGTGELWVLSEKSGLLAYPASR
ncbi:MAG: hypothetical protein AB7F75_04950 [Planctomycetota bacterium]